MKRLLTAIVAFMAVTACFAQASDFRDYIVTRQKYYATSDNWAWDPIWGLNYGANDIGKGKVRDCMRRFFNNMTVQVKEGKNNNGRLLFLTHKVSLNNNDFWLLSGFKWKKANQTDIVDEVVDNNKQYLVDRINEWAEPFGFSVELAKNSDIGRMRYRNLIEYNNHGVWVIVKPNQVAAMKKARESNFTKIVKVVDNRGNLDYHPFGDLMKEYNKTHKRGQQEDEHTSSPFDDGPITIGH